MLYIYYHNFLSKELFNLCKTLKLTHEIDIAFGIQWNFYFKEAVCSVGNNILLYAIFRVDMSLNLTI